jgi:hypothetical protein
MLSASFKEPQSAASALMVRPASFGFNPQTAATNGFLVHALRAGFNGVEATPSEKNGAGKSHEAAPADIQDRALREFDALAELLGRKGVRVVVADDTAEPVKPDAIFPNNWVSFHRDGTVVLYPMLAANRRAERREEVVRRVIDGGAFRASRTVDLSHREDEGKYLEGTGSLVLDRMQRIAYASLSPRTDLDVLGEFSQQLDYELVTFEALDGAGKAVYHTNVMMALGAQFAVVCGPAIAELNRRDAVYSRLRATGREIIEISSVQMHEFAGNLLELAPSGSNVIALSATAWRGLDAAQRRALERYGEVVAADIPVIERFGGGSVRCMLAEIHLPARL